MSPPILNIQASTRRSFYGKVANNSINELKFQGAA